MSSFDLRVVISKPLWGDYDHWGIVIFDRDEETHLVVEALGEPHRFTTSSEVYAPKSMPRYSKTLDVICLGNLEIEDIQAIIETVPVRNDLSHWSCQDYVIEIFDALEEADVLKKTPSYNTARQALVIMYGPMEEARDKILACRASGEHDSNINTDESDAIRSEDQKSNKTGEEPRILSEEFVIDSDDEDDIQAASLFTPELNNPWTRSKG